MAIDCAAQVAIAGSYAVRRVSLQSGLAGVFRPEFVTDLAQNRANWFTTALDGNSVDACIPSVPMRLYNGIDDDIRSPTDAKTFHDFARARGGNVSLHLLGRIGHDESSAHAYLPTLRWFDSLTPRRLWLAQRRSFRVTDLRSTSLCRRLSRAPMRRSAVPS